MKWNDKISIYDDKKWCFKIKLDVFSTCNNSPALKLFIDCMILTNSFSVLWSVPVILAVIVNKRFSACNFNAFNPPNSLLLLADDYDNRN